MAFDAEGESHLGFTRICNGLRKKALALNKDAWQLLSGLETDQVLDLILLVEESIENFSESIGKRPEYAKQSSVHLFRKFFLRMADFIDSDVDDYDVPEQVSILEAFAALSASKASRALEYLYGRAIGAAEVSACGSKQAAVVALGADAVIEAAEALAAGFAESNLYHGLLTPEEKEKQREENIQLGRVKGAKANSARYDPLRALACRLYDNMHVAREDALGEFKAAGIILQEVIDFGIAEKILPKFEDCKHGKDPLTVETVYHWLKRQKKKQEWERLLSEIAEADATYDEDM